MSTPAPEYAKVPPLTLPERGLVRAAGPAPARADERRDKLNFDGLSDNELQQYVRLVIVHFLFFFFSLKFL